MQKTKVLYIEDNEFDKKAMIMALDPTEYEVNACSTIGKGKDLMLQNQYDIVLSDYTLEDGTAKDLLDDDLDLPIIITTGTGNEEIAVQLLKAGARDYLIKDVEGNYLKMLPILIKKTIKYYKAEVAQSQLISIIENSPDAIYSEDLHGTILSWNKGAEQILGFRAHEIIGKTNDLIIPENKKHEKTLIFQKIRQGEFLNHYETTRISKYNKAVNVSLSFSPVYSLKGKLKGIAIIGRDITEQEKNKSALIQSENELTRYIEDQKKKDQFIAMASHELKSPLTTVMSYIQLAESLIQPGSEKEGDNVKGFLKRAITNSNRLSRLVNDLLDISKIQADRLQFDMEQVDLNVLIKETVAAFQNTDPVHNYEVVGSCDAYLMSDRNRIIQVLTNYLSNAAKYSPNGGPIVVNISSNDYSVQVSVKDTGIGISKENQQHVYDRFFRVADDKYRSMGLGIGLYIVKEIIKLHGGEVWVESEPGKGSEFFFRLPFKNKNN